MTLPLTKSRCSSANRADPAQLIHRFTQVDQQSRQLPATARNTGLKIWLKANGESRSGAKPANQPPLMLNHRSGGVNTRCNPASTRCAAVSISACANSWAIGSNPRLTKQALTIEAVTVTNTPTQRKMNWRRGCRVGQENFIRTCAKIVPVRRTAKGCTSSTTRRCNVPGVILRNACSCQIIDRNHQQGPANKAISGHNALT